MPLTSDVDSSKFSHKSYTGCGKTEHEHDKFHKQLIHCAIRSARQTSPLGMFDSRLYSSAAALMEWALQ